MKIKEVTSLVEWDFPDGEDLPLLRCICGATWKPWQGPILSIYEEAPTECLNCGRSFFWKMRVEVFEIT